MMALLSMMEPRLANHGTNPSLTCKDIEMLLAKKFRVRAEPYLLSPHRRGACCLSQTFARDFTSPVASSTLVK